MTLTKPVSALRKQAEKQNDSVHGGTFWRVLDFMLSLVFTMLAVFCIRSVLIDPIRVKGTSMLDTLEEGEIMLVNRLSYIFEQPQNGDIVICYYPDDYYETRGKTYNSRVKRVIANAGDTIEAYDGTVYVNGEAVQEPYLTESRIGSLSIAKQTVPDGCCYVLGDNRSVSIDSRDPDVGPIPYTHIIGKVKMVLFPLSDLRLIK